MTVQFPVTSGFFQSMDAADAHTAEHQRLRDFRAQVAQLLGIPPNATDAFILNEIDHMARRVEAWDWDHQGVRPEVVGHG